MVQSRFCKSTTLLIVQVAWTSPAWNSTKEFKFQSQIICIPILCIVWSKDTPRLGMLFYILSLSLLGSISRGLACHSISYHALAVSAVGLAFLSRPGSICRGLACYSIYYHALAASTEAWHAILYLITPWQYPLSLGMLFYILSRLGSISWGLACYSIS